MLMFGSFVLENLFGLSLVTIAVSLSLGIFVAYLLWGRRYHDVMAAEAATARLRRESDELRTRQHRLKTELAS